MCQVFINVFLIILWQNVYTKILIINFWLLSKCFIPSDNKLMLHFMKGKRFKTYWVWYALMFFYFLVFLTQKSFLYFGYTTKFVLIGKFLHINYILLQSYQVLGRNNNIRLCQNTSGFLYKNLSLWKRLFLHDLRSPWHFETTLTRKT